MKSIKSALIVLFYRWGKRVPRVKATCPPGPEHSIGPVTAPSCPGDTRYPADGDMNTSWRPRPLGGQSPWEHRLHSPRDLEAPGLLGAEHTRGLCHHEPVLGRTTSLLSEDFPGGPRDKNRPANAGDMGSIPRPGRSHVLQSN